MFTGRQLWDKAIYPEAGKSLWKNMKHVFFLLVLKKNL